MNIPAVCFLRNVENEFNAHIDAPAEENLARLQHNLDVAEDSTST